MSVMGLMLGGSYDVIIMTARWNEVKTAITKCHKYQHYSSTI